MVSELAGLHKCQWHTYSELFTGTEGVFCSICNKRYPIEEIAALLNAPPATTEISAAYEEIDRLTTERDKARNDLAILREEYNGLEVQLDDMAQLERTLEDDLDNVQALLVPYGHTIDDDCETEAECVKAVIAQLTSADPTLHRDIAAILDLRGHNGLLLPASVVVSAIAARLASGPKGES